MKEKVALAFSGGADSTYAAIALKDMGYEVVAFNFPIGRKIPGHISDTAKKLDIKLEIIDIRNIFDQVIKENFYSSYIKGYTPNPCVRCNRYIKFGLLYTIVKTRFKIDKLATGHYAKIVKDQNGRFFIGKAKDKKKDQSYFLWGIPRSILPYIIFPLQDMNKEDIRKILKKEGFEQIANREESYDICFVNETTYKEYIKNYGLNESGTRGNFVDKNGNIIGVHQGIYRYTIGQRKGLNIALGKRMYVRRIDPIKNEVEIGEKPYTKRVYANNVNIFLDEQEFLRQKEYSAKIRYKSKEEKANIKILNNDNIRYIELNFVEKAEASSLGQSLVIYDDDIIIAGGIIEKIDII